MSKRGLSMDEKKKRTLEYMHERREVFTLKELESGVPKAKGVGQSGTQEGGKEEERGRAGTWRRSGRRAHDPLLHRLLLAAACCLLASRSRLCVQ